MFNTEQKKPFNCVIENKRLKNPLINTAVTKKKEFTKAISQDILNALIKFSHLI